MSAIGPKRTKADFGPRPLSANDPTATLAVHCGNGFDAGFNPYQSTRLNRYDAPPGIAIAGILFAHDSKQIQIASHDAMALLNGVPPTMR
jgi:hypothetical protein